ncbi:cecropin-B1-like [Topomyia yanbarensis]|uniref:cecropin-B1-like n=1 Tax=Topomyia yanbarensis TaxID=2498891 RepID=UPI00273BA612|nr:cecropin-B1-like [Topomyia yanbarensis]
MKFNKLFLIVVLAALLLSGLTEAGKWKKFGKEIEKTGKRVFKAVEKAVPVVLSTLSLGQYLKKSPRNSPIPDDEYGRSRG